jgi:UDP-N-acetylglucosamine 1-carboxyvinyltransferase
MAARYGRATIFPPGGDLIGRRPLDTHFSGLARLGIDMRGQRSHVFERRHLEGARILLEEASVTATENVIMAAVLAPGETTIYNAACEPHVQDLCNLLRAMGARIDGIGTNSLRIQGVEALHGARYRVQPDYVDAATFVAAAVLTHSELEIEGVVDTDLEVLQAPFRKLGVSWRTAQDVLTVSASQTPRVQNDLRAAIPKIEDGPWPAVPSDVLSLLIVLATQAHGTVLFFEKMFESRLYFADRLIEMGARIVQCDPHRIIVTGPARLFGTRLSSPDIRAGVSLVLAALCAKGESIIQNAESIDRGYEQIDRELRRLGADLVRVE